MSSTGWRDRSQHAYRATEVSQAKAFPFSHGNRACLVSVVEGSGQRSVFRAQGWSLAEPNSKGTGRRPVPVVRGRIELPTLGFSDRCSTN